MDSGGAEFSGGVLEGEVDEGAGVASNRDGDDLLAVEDEDAEGQVVGGEGLGGAEDSDDFAPVGDADGSLPAALGHEAVGLYEDLACGDGGLCGHLVNTDIGTADGAEGLAGLGGDFVDEGAGGASDGENEGANGELHRAFEPVSEGLLGALAEGAHLRAGAEGEVEGCAGHEREEEQRGQGGEEHEADEPVALRRLRLVCVHSRWCWCRFTRSGG